MKITVELQEPFSYALWPLILLGILLLIMIVILIYKKRPLKSKQKETDSLQNKMVAAPQVDKQALKQKYIKELIAIQNDFEQNKVSTRKAYQKTSVLVRRFVYEVTGVKVHHYTLSEIKGLNMPVLENLIFEFYSPEFEVKSQGDVIAAIEKTKRIIETWN